MEEAGRQEEDRPTNAGVARVLHRIADLLEFLDENPFKLRSYRLAAETVEEMPREVADLAARGGAAELRKIDGIGPSISAQILEILATGTSSQFETLKAEVPETVLDLRRIPGIGLKTAQILYREFGVKDLEDLNAFAEGDGLLSVRGLGEKTRDRIQTSLGSVDI